MEVKDLHRAFKCLPEAMATLHSKCDCLPSLIVFTGEVELADVLYDGEQHLVLSGPRVATGNTHGTGCTTASAIAAYLARGMTVPNAVKAAKNYVTDALRQSAHLSLGNGNQKPFNHM